MISVILHGRLEREYGSTPIKMAVSSLAEAVRALSVLRPGIKNALRKGWYRILCVKADKNIDLETEDIHLRLKGVEELHVIPVVAGSKNGGIFKIILGIALVAGAFLLAGPAGLGATAFSFFGANISYGTIAALGAAVALSGVSQMLAPTPDPSKDRDDKKSFLFNGATNTSTQGVPVPLVFGRFRPGSVVASAGISVEQIGENSVNSSGG